MACRLSASGFGVTGWTRSGRTIEGLAAAPDPSAAVRGADVVLLALFDDAACAAVLDAVRPSLSPHAVVVNTSTIGPQEAAALAGDVGAAYVHAPVLGSVPAVEVGGLTVLAAGAALERVRPVLEALGTITAVNDAATAAALKLVANSSLAGAVLALRDSLQHAEALGLTREQALGILAHGPMGGMVNRKRSYLAGEPNPAEFTVGALAKDMGLLAEASHLPLRAAAELAESPAGHDADIALAATVPPVTAAVLAPLRAYVRGHATDDPAHFREAFLPSAHVEGIRDGAFVSWPLETYCALFSGRPASDENSRSRRIDAVDVHGTVATASMTLYHGPDTFTDVFLLVLVDGSWKIVNKAYHRQSGPHVQ